MHLRIRFGWLCLMWVLLLPACSDDGDDEPEPAPSRFVSATPVGSWEAAQLQLLVQFSGTELDPALVRYDAQIFRMVYKTRYRDQDIEASGLVALPVTTEAVPIISFHRGTIVEHEDAPSVQTSNTEEVILYAALSSMGYIAVIPDMLGFGSATSVLHPYYIEEPTAAAVVDMLIAAEELARQQNTGFNSDVYLAGYSQGGYITMAAHKALEENPVKGFNLAASFPAAGGYDLHAMQEYFFTVGQYSDPHYLAYLGAAYAEYYDNPDIITAMFAPQYAEIIPGLFNGTTSKTQIDAALTEDMNALLNPELLANPADPKFAPFMTLLDENTLTDWAPEAPMYMYHGDADVAVPYSNSVSTYDKLVANGSTSITFITLEGHTHGSGITPYVEDVVRKLAEMRD